MDGLDPQLYWQGLLAWIEGLGPTAVIAFIGIYALATVFLFPGSLLTLGGGVLFGVVWGSVYVLVGASLGATLAFLIGRYWARGWVERKLARSPQFRVMDQLIQKAGWKIALLTRLSPVFPFVLLNYAYGITGVSLRDYLWGCVGMVPGTVLYVYLGALAGSVANLRSPGSGDNPGLQWAVRGLGLLATVAVTVYLSRVAQQALQTELREESTSNAENPSFPPKA